MRKSLKVLAASALVLAFATPMQSSAQWYGPGYGYGPHYGPGYYGPGYGRGWGDWFGLGDMFGDIGFSVRGSGRGWGRGYGRGDGWGYYDPYIYRGYGYAPYHGGPWGAPAPQQLESE
ncbi:MAG: sulfur globule protein [Thioalkalivibrio sp.]|nr:sulfur globule protein [Thioalkalivibrio sp.]